MADTPNLQLPLIASNQAQKEVTHNAALRTLDVLVQLSVKDRDLTAPPGSPAEGDRYIVASGATGAWDDKDLNIAAYIDGAWAFLPANLGWQVWVEDEGTLLVWVGAPTYWQDIAAAGGFVTVTGIAGGAATKIGVNTAADDTNRLAVKSDAILLSHDDVTPGNGNILAVLNKATAGDDAGFVFQNGFSARALFGLLADDDWTVKVSPDGSAFKTAIVADKDTGAVALSQHPKFHGYCNYDQYNAADAWFTVDINNTVHNDQAALSGGIFTAPHDGYYAFGAGVRLLSDGTPPTNIILGLSLNNGNPSAYYSSIAGEGSATLDNFTAVTVTGLMKLTAGQTVRVKAFFTSQDSSLDADYSYFWGHQVP